MDKGDYNPLNPKVVLGVAAHADDLDFGASGTMAKWADKGADVYYLILTDGSKGTQDRTLKPNVLKKLRQQEQRDAAKIIGAKKVFFCNYEDGCLECCKEVKQDICAKIRQIKPDVVITMDPTMTYVANKGFINHPDHRAAGQATLDAVFPLARDHLSFPNLLKKGLEPHKTPVVLLVNLEKQNWYEDISQYINKKMKALSAHKSQMPNIKEAQQMMREEAEELGNKCDCNYAEGFMRIDIE